MVRKLRGRGASGFILYFLRPLRYLFSRFGVFLAITLALIAIFISKTQPQTAEKMRMTVVDAGAGFTGMLLTPVDWFDSVSDYIEQYLFVHEKNEELRGRNRELENRLSLIAQAEFENRRLKQLLNFVKEPGYNYISARVVGDTTSAFIRSILINAGKWSGIEPGQAVVNEKGVIGRVIEVGKHSARVLLLTDINSRIPVIGAHSGVRSILAGNNKEHPELTYLGENTKIMNGEQMLTSGDGELFPSGLNVGTVYQSPEDSRFYAKPFASLESLQFVSVLEYKRPQAIEASDIEPEMPTVDVVQ